MKTKLLLLLFLFLPSVLYVQGTEIKDTLSYTYNDQITLFHPRQLILPVSLVAVRSWGICNGFLKSVNHTVKDNMTDLRNDCYFHADDYIQYLPIVSYAGLGLIGTKAKHPFRERIIITATSYLAMGNYSAIQIRSFSYTN